MNSPPSASPSARAGTVRARSRPRPVPASRLMSEFLGLAYFAEIPMVLFNIQRGGPSTGMPTRTQQSDILSCAYASHGDTKHVLLFPSDPNECFTMPRQCFRSGGAVADAGDGDERSRHRHERLGDRRVQLGRRAGARSRQGDRCRRTSTPIHLGAAIRTSTVTASAIARCQGRIRPWVPILHAAPLTTRTAKYTEDGVIHARVLDRIARKINNSPGNPAATGCDSGQCRLGHRRHLFRCQPCGRTRRHGSARR